VDAERGPGAHSFVVELLHLLGEVEAVFGIWCIRCSSPFRLLKGTALGRGVPRRVTSPNATWFAFLGLEHHLRLGHRRARASRTKPKYAGPRAFDVVGRVVVIAAGHGLRRRSHADGQRNLHGSAY